MTLTVLAVIFLLLILSVAVFGQRFLSRKTEELKAAGTFQCSICRASFEKQELVEREIGDFKILYFCGDCIRSLHAELASRQATMHGT